MSPLCTDGLWDTVPVPIVTTTGDGEVTGVNGAFREMIGGNVEVVGESCWEWFTMVDARFAPSVAGWRRLFGDPVGADLDVLVRRVDGSTVASQLRVRTTTDGLVMVVKSRDDEIRQQVRLRASQERLEKLAENVPAGILSSQAGMRIDYANQRCCEVFGVAAEVLVGFGWLDYLHPDDAVAAEEAIVGVIAGASEAHLPLRIDRTDGTVRWAEMRIAAVHNGNDVGFVATIEDVTESRKLTEELIVQARHDSLTGLPNRIALRELLARRLEHRPDAVALLFVDLDHFKDVNDSLGHGAGDRLLMVVAERLRRCVRANDVVARFGGDEFVVLVDCVEGHDAVAGLADRILAAMRMPIDLASQAAFVSASVGVVYVTGSEAYDAGTSAGLTVPEHVDALLRDADIAMYRAKNSGGNQAALFDQTMRADAQARLQMQGALRRALDDLTGELSMVYQPIVTLDDRRPRGLEALMRWDLPSVGRVSPDAFVPLAEETGLIVRLSRLAIERSLSDLAAWRRLGLARYLWVSVNLSARDLAEPDLVEAVQRALERTGIDAGSLRLELTESAVMADHGRAFEVLAQLKELGIGISVDDFGTGHSSLAYLQQLPVDTVKIDRVFVDSLGVERSATALVEAIVAMSAALGLSVVAEGVEEEYQVALLTELGVRYAQGYHFDRPMTSAGVVAALTDDRVSRRVQPEIDVTMKPVSLGSN